MLCRLLKSPDLGEKRSSYEYEPVGVCTPESREFQPCHSASYYRQIYEAGKGLKLRDPYSTRARAAALIAIQNGAVCNDVRVEQELLRQADILAVVYPLRWSGMPAMPKGIIERAFSKNLPMSSTRPAESACPPTRKSFLSRPRGRHGKTLHNEACTEALS